MSKAVDDAWKEWSDFDDRWQAIVDARKAEGKMSRMKIPHDLKKKIIQLRMTIDAIAQEFDGEQGGSDEMVRASMVARKNIGQQLRSAASWMWEIE